MPDSSAPHQLDQILKHTSLAEAPRGGAPQTNRQYVSMFKATLPRGLPQSLPPYAVRGTGRTVVGRGTLRQEKDRPEPKRRTGAST